MCLHASDSTTDRRKVTKGHVGLEVWDSLLVENVAVHYSNLHQPKHHLPPPLYCVSDEAVVYSMLVCQVYTVHVVVVTVYDHWFDSWGTSGGDSR